MRLALNSLLLNFVPVNFPNAFAELHVKGGSCSTLDLHMLFGKLIENSKAKVDHW